MLSVSMLSVSILSVSMVSVSMLSVSILSVSMLSVVAPFFTTVSYVPEISSDVDKFISFSPQGGVIWQ
jgi:hypothetical protein